MRIKIRDPRWIRVAGWLIAAVLRVWMATIRHRIESRFRGIHPADPSRARYIYAVWHESLLFLLLFRRPAYVLISQHADGEMIAQACRRLGVGTVRGSTTRGGGAGLLGLIERAADGHLILMPDGPRGPRRTVHLGIVALASHTGLPVVPVGVGCTRGWRAKSWDRFLVPWPFATATFTAEGEVVVPPGLDREAMEPYRLEIERKLLVATEAAERWADALAGRRPPGDVVASVEAPSRPHAAASAATVMPTSPAGRY